MPEDLLSQEDRAILEKPDLPPTKYGDIEKQHPIVKVHTDNTRGLADAPVRNLKEVPALDLHATRNSGLQTLRETSLLKADPVKSA